MRSLRLPVVIATLLLLVGLGSLAAAIAGDPLRWTPVSLPVLGASATIGVEVGAVSATLLVFIAGLSLITAEYSRRNLRGQARLARFSALHITATLALALLVTGASLPLLAVGWTISGLAIAALVAHRGTTAATRAAGYVRRRLLLADALLWSAVVAAAVVLPSLDRVALGASAAGAAPVGITVVALLLVGAAVIRSALFPAHRWLYETAEAPSPVSALLHAGVVNAVGLLGVLVWPIFAASLAARAALIGFGLVAAVALSIATRYRADVKGRLAASTSAQMGYLSIQVGLGLPVAGLLHVIGHGSYKAYLFLRAGGAVTRSREGLASGSARVRPVAVLAAILLAASATAIGLSAWPSVPAADLLPIGVAAAAAAVAGYAVLRPGRSLRAVVANGSSALALAAIGALLAGYLVLLGVWTTAFPGFSAASEVWSTAALAGWFGLIGLGLALAVPVPWLIDAGRMPWLRAHIGAAALPPTHRVPEHWALAAPQAPANDPAPMVALAVDAALPVVGPAWPLRSVVAANPLSGLEDLHVRDAGAIAHRSWGARTLPERSYYLAAMDQGRITAADLHAAAALAPGVAAQHEPGLVVAALLAVSGDAEAVDPLLRSAVFAALRPLPAAAIASLNAAAGDPPVTRSLTEGWDARSNGSGMRLTEIADGHAAAWLADLLIADAPPTGPGQLWRSWQARVGTAGMDRHLGVPGFGAAAANLPHDPVTALAVLLGDVPADQHVAYLSRLLARNPGWPSHLSWRAASGGEDLRQDLLAIRAAYDVLLTRAVAGPPVPAAGARSDAIRPAVITATAAVLDELGHDAETVAALAAPEVHGIASLASALAGPAGAAIWQAAFEQRYRNRVLDRIETRAAVGPESPAAPQVHVAMCIDVRSERMRRHLEADPAVATYGFAGFFGLAIRHLPSAGAASDQCPVLIRPARDIAEQLAILPVQQGSSRQLGAAALAATSASTTPFAVAEAAAPVTGTLALAQTMAPRTWRRARDWAYGPAASGLRGELQIDAAMSPADQIAAAYGFLHGIGQLEVGGSLFVIAGHGAHIENNAYAAAYQCGACGGNSGYVNARVMAELLNRPQVRAGLAQRGVRVAPEVVAVPALHVTTTDELHIDDADVPAQAAQAVAAFRRATAGAQEASAAERVATLPAGRRKAPLADVARRSADWAEATPEWGLAGNALFVAGPRWMTRGLNLRGRSFLHSYDPAHDDGFAVLETILTAPMVVAHWISSQYYASTVDPERFGAGDKTTHNAVSDIAVLSGAHGDLRVGLPWQSLFDADPVAGRPGIGHEPLRLQVVVYAPAEAVQQVIAAHPEVARLVTGEWLSLAVIEPVGARTLRLTPDLAWEPWDSDPLAIGAADLTAPGNDRRRESSSAGGTMRA